MQRIKNAILSSAYFPPIQYVSKVLSYETVLIEAHENFSKQSYRNRCEILSSNGKQTLSIPVIKQSGSKQNIKDIKIDYTEDWQSIHLKSIQAAYFSSPFFEYYIDAFIPYFKKEFTYLFDLNLQVLDTLLTELQIEKKVILSESFQNELSYDDYRNSIHPKLKFRSTDKMYKDTEYIQVFSEKFEFIPNLSILDLIFNEGPNFENVLKQSIII